MESGVDAVIYMNDASSSPSTGGRRGLWLYCLIVLHERDDGLAPQPDETTAAVTTF